MAKLEYKTSEGQKWLILRQRINKLFAKLQKQYGQIQPGLRLTTQRFAESLDTGHPDCLPVTSKKCPKSIVSRLDMTYFALLEGIVRAFWKKNEANLLRMLPLLEEVEKIGLKQYSILGCTRTGFYLFLPGKAVRS